jgi:hypothetical protein
MLQPLDRRVRCDRDKGNAYMKAPKILAAPIMAALTGLTMGCGVQVDPQPGSSPGTASSARRTEALLASSLALAHKARFEVTSLEADRFAGSLRIDREAIGFDVSVLPSGTVRANLRDKEGTDIAAIVKSNGWRAVRYNGHRIDVSPAGRVAPDAFAGISGAMRVALGLIPLDLACAHAGGDVPLMEALALPFNLVQRAEPGTVGARDLLPAATCRREANGASGYSSSDLLKRAKLVVPGRGT